MIDKIMNDEVIMTSDGVSGRAPRIIDTLYFYAIYMFVNNVPARLFGGQYAVQAGNQHDPTLRIISALLMVWTAVFIFPRLRRAKRYYSGQIMLIVLTLYWLGGTVIWPDSTNPLGPIRGISLFIFSIICLSLLFDAEEVLKKIANISTFLALISIPAQYLLPANGDLAPGWSGVFLQKNSLGVAMAIGLVSLLMLKDQWTPFKLFKFSACAVLLILSQSATAFLCTAVCAAYLTRNRLKKNDLAALIIIAFLGVLLVGVIQGNIVKLFLAALGKDEGLTGRTAIWTMALQGFLERPIFGYGTGGFWRESSQVAITMFNWNPGQAHNGYLQSLLDYGIFGTGMIFVYLGHGVYSAYRSKAQNHIYSSKFSLTITLFVLVHCIAESDLLAISPAWFVLVLSYLLCARDQAETCVS